MGNDDRVYCGSFGAQEVVGVSGEVKEDSRVDGWGTNIGDLDSVDVTDVEQLWNS
jgi:hypothetical protein